jgi:hypothetical protein
MRADKIDHFGGKTDEPGGKRRAMRSSGRSRTARAFPGGRIMAIDRRADRLIVFTDEKSPKLRGTASRQFVR